MHTRLRTLRSKRGGAPVSDTPYCDIEFPLELRRWRAMGIHEPTLLADYTMSEEEFWKKVNNVASHYQDCSKRLANDPTSWDGNRNVASGVTHKRFEPPTFIERVYELNPRKSPHDRWSYDENNKYTLLRAVREAERQCVSRKPKLSAYEKKTDANRKNTLKKKWANYNTGKAVWLGIKAEADAVKKEIVSFEEIGTHTSSQTIQNFNEEGKTRIRKINAKFTPHFADNILLNEIKECLSKDDVDRLKIHMRTLEEEYDRFLRNSQGPRGRMQGLRWGGQKERLFNLLKKYVSLQEMYLRSKTDFNKNTNRNSFYKSERKNPINLTAENRKNKTNAVDKRQQFWNTYNRNKKANLKTNEIDEIKRYFNSFAGKGTVVEGTQDIDFDKINRLLDADDKVGVEDYIKLLRNGPQPVHTKEKSVIIGKLEEYVGYINYRDHLKPMYNRSDVARKTYYEEKRAKELEGLF